MTYQDSWAICTQCGAQFVFRVEDQRQQAARGEPITPPALCPACRSQTGRETEAVSGSKPQARTERSKRAEPLDPGPHEGRVKWYDSEKGYGFIIHPTGEEIFFHRTGLTAGETPPFPDGTRVTYVIEMTAKGPQAIEVARMDETDDQEAPATTKEDAA